MLLIDYNQAMILSLTAGKGRIQRYSEDEMRLAFIEKLRQIIKKYKTSYGQTIVCCDAKHSWRKDFFPLYKASRKAEKEASTIDWPWIMSAIDTFRDELVTHFPFKTIHVDGAEADDIIAVLCRNIPEKHLIYSSDRDFLQLQSLDYVEQYSPTTQNFITIDNPEMYLKEKIIKGDRGDGIPNILSEDNIFMIPDKRQKSITTGRLSKWLPMEPDEFCDNATMLRNWHRNKTLIDFHEIPNSVSESIINTYENAPIHRKDGLLKYFMNHRATDFIKDIQDF